jgi:hypothetical protein
MRKIGIFALVGFVVSMAACQPSLQPLFTEQEAMFDQNYLGNWVNDDGDIATFEKSASSGKVYSLIYKDAKTQKAAKFLVTLGRLGNSYYLDAIRRNDDLSDENEIATFGLVGIHWIFKVSRDGDVLHTAILSGEWCDQLASRNKLRVGHTKVVGTSVGFDAHTILTASTHDLQKFIVKAAQSKDAFSSPTDWHRQK